MRCLVVLGSLASIAHADGYRLRDRTPAVPASIDRVQITRCIFPWQLRPFIQRHTASVTRCYDRALRDSPRLAGRLTASFVITDAGTVTESRASGLDANLAQCVAHAMSRIQFPKGLGVVTVHYPFTFAPRP